MEEVSIHPEYLKGFNSAYLLAQYKPQLIEQLLTHNIDNEYFRGMKDGKRIFEQERSQSRLKELENLNSQQEKER